VRPQRRPSNRLAPEIGVIDAGIGNTRGMSERRSSFVDRVLDGHARIDQLDGEVQAWLAGSRTRPLADVLGLSADELDLVATTPDALRYVVHARRFDRPVELDELAGQVRIRRHATRLAADVVDPFELADIESWSIHVDVDSAAARAEREPSHA
jgi:hypothetical protein